MKTPTVAEIAAALGIRKQTLYADGREGCPLHSVAAAREWRRLHRRPKIRVDRRPPTLAELLAKEPLARDIDVLDAIDREMALIPRGMAIEIVHALAHAGAAGDAACRRVLPELLRNLPADLIPGADQFVE